MSPIPTDGVGMQANVGDQLLVEGPTAETHRRSGEILEVHGADGAPPYLVKWSGPDAHVVAGRNASGS
jgi:hypothetical protein